MAAEALTVHVYPADFGACGNLRLRWPGLELADHGVTVYDPGQEDGLQFRSRRRPDGSEHCVFDEAPADVVVLQRPVDRKWVDVIDGLHDVGVKVVVDFDDDLAGIAPKHVAFDAYHPTRSPDRNWKWALAAAEKADRVTCATRALMNRYGRDHGWLLENCIPESMLAVRRTPNDRLVVGWSGRCDTHPGDLAEVGNGLVLAKRQLDFDWKVIGRSEGVKRESGLEPILHPWCPPDQYARALATLDIGLAPLRIHAFNQSKSWLKPLEYAAVGVPFVCSPTDPYLRLVNMGIGLIAEKPQAWQREIRALVLSSALRDDLAGRGRAVAEQWTIEKNADRWLEAWTSW